MDEVRWQGYSQEGGGRKGREKHSSLPNTFTDDADLYCSTVRSLRTRLPSSISSCLDSPHKLPKLCLQLLTSLLRYHNINFSYTRKPFHLLLSLFTHMSRPLPLFSFLIGFQFLTVTYLLMKRSVIIRGHLSLQVSPSYVGSPHLLRIGRLSSVGWFFSGANLLLAWPSSVNAISGCWHVRWALMFIAFYFHTTLLANHMSYPFPSFLPCSKIQNKSRLDLNLI